MSHISSFKLFESSSKTYTELSHDVWISFANNRINLQGSKYVEIIKKFISDNSYIGEVELSQKDFRIIIRSNLFQLGRKTYSDIGIDVCPDEWFYLHINNYGGIYKHYKCDQLEGLFDCLRNEVNW